MTALGRSFANPIFDSQRVFRAVLAAMAEPGACETLGLDLVPFAPLPLAATAVALALLDSDTPLYIDEAARPAMASLTFHCGCPRVDGPKQAAFAVIADVGRMPPFADFNQGSDLDPDRSTTLILALPALSGGPVLTLRGPGIPDRRHFAPQGLPVDFIQQWQANSGHFPAGVDLILTAGADLACLPRSTKLEV